MATPWRRNCAGAIKAALIDEFQDTDPVQYQIFHRAFSGGKSFLFLIGDPKQAIYAFRGADIFTYLEAAKEATRRFTLGENWRSEAGLVVAVNKIFSAAPQAFVFDRIDFQEAIPRGRPTRLRSPLMAKPSRRFISGFGSAPARTSHGAWPKRSCPGSWPARSPGCSTATPGSGSGG